MRATPPMPGTTYARSGGTITTDPQRPLGPAHVGSAFQVLVATTLAAMLSAAAVVASLLYGKGQVMPIILVHGRHKSVRSRCLCGD